MSKKKRFTITLFLGFMLLSTFTTPLKAQSMQTTTKKTLHPQTKKIEHIDEYFGNKILDPYRWLEDLDSEETKKWVESQNQYTFSYFGQIATRQKIKDRLSKLWNFERYSIPFKRASRYFYFKNDGLQNQSVLYIAESLNDTPRVLLDPNTLSSDGTVALSSYSISEDGKLMAYGISSAGSDWMEWKVRDVDTGKDLGDQLNWIKFSGASWSKDNKGFYYSRYNEPKPGATYEETNYNQKVYYHKVGTKQSEDTLVYERPDKKEWGFSAFVTEDGRYLVISVSQGTDVRNLLFYKDLQEKESKVVELISDFEAEYDFIDNEGSVFWFKTNLEAPRGKAIAVDITKPEKKNWKELIPQTAETLGGIGVVGNHFIASYLKDAYTQIKLFSLDGKFVREVKFPGVGTAGGFGGKRQDNETFYAFTNFTTPSRIYRYNIATGESTLYRQPKVDFNPEDYEVKQVFYTSKDGTKVPMFISHKKGLKLDGTNPTILYGYGGFNISLTPSFSISNLVWMEMGGVYAVPNLRGGGEYGEEWHKAGTKLKKQNVFDDFISAAEWLIANKYTSTPKLAISGGSNGGLLVGACLTQRPDLFGAALPAVGVLDMLRFHKFTIGWAWTSDYGSPENPEEFKALYSYSPLHNIKPGTRYPATLILTADHDDRVVPAHSFKFAATLQAAQDGEAPVLIRIETRAGHGAGQPISKVIDQVADTWGFLTRVLDMKLEAKNN